jgi:acyl carrier protein
VSEAGINGFSLTPNEVLAEIDSKRRSRPELSSPFIGPRNDTEVQIAELWCEVLRIDQVGIDDNFLDLGGDSLQMLRIISRLRDRFEIDIPLGQIFDSLSVSRLALLVDAAGIE